jgi:ABC-type nitrate/sulfonate/bicarbonate transport system substrate-binding protein
MRRRSFIRLVGGGLGLTFAGPRWSPVNAAGLRSLSFQASWSNDAEFAGYFLAIDRGYYQQSGIDLNYFSGGPDLIPEASLVSGRADIALTVPETTAKAVASQGAKFKIIGTQYQKSPLGIVSLAKTQIRAPQDLKGKTLAVAPVNTLAVRAFLRLNQISNVRVVPYQYDPTSLLKGEIDASVDFVTNVPYTIKLSGAEPSSFLLYDFGFTVFNDTVVVTEEGLKSKRQDFVDWLRASRRGWEDNFAAAESVPKEFKGTWFKGTGRTIENEVFYNEAQKPLIVSPSGIFSMNDEDIEKNVRALTEIGLKVGRDLFDSSLLAEVG